MGGNLDIEFQVLHAFIILWFTVTGIITPGGEGILPGVTFKFPTVSIE